MSTSTKIGHGLAKALGIKLQNRHADINEDITRGESVFSVDTADTFIEQEPTSAEWIRETIPSGATMIEYSRSLFPFTYWIGRYNLQWLYGDLVAGITIGAVVVPQGMAYALLAQLPTQYGLYSSFMGVLIYWFFATSKDITIGPVAVMSTIVGNIVIDCKTSLPQYEGHVIASALAVIAGSIILFGGLARLGWVVELISLTSISAFMTGSAINIAVGQVPTLMGLQGVNSRDATYLVIINSLRALPTTQIDAAIGLTALFLLYAIRSACKFAAKKHPQKQKLIFFISTLRTVFTILLYTLISWLVNRNYPGAPAKSRFKILGVVPRGFTQAAVPTINTTIIRAFVSQLPATVIVLLIEHIAIAKSFGRINNYVINPSQELVAIGVTNMLGPFLGAYPATGSFSRTAIKAKAGVRTPLAGMITAVIVLLAIYALPVVFQWIPNPALSAVIIHAVGDLITPPNTIYQFWRVSPLEVLIFFLGVLVTIFSSIENGIYCTVAVSFAVMLFRILKAKGRFLGVVSVHSLSHDSVNDHFHGNNESKNDLSNGNFEGFGNEHKKDDGAEFTIPRTRNIYIPLQHDDGSNPDIEVKNPYPGVFIYRFSEGFNYPNANHYLDHLTSHIFANTRRTNPDSWGRPGDRPWNDPGPRRGQVEANVDHRPTLKAIILDFSSVNNVDITSVQQLIDVRNQLDRYTSPDRVDWHFACINNRWTKRALVSAGFGTPIEDDGSLHRRWKPIFSVASIGGTESAAHAAQFDEDEHELELQRQRTNKSFSAKEDEIASSSTSDNASEIDIDRVMTKKEKAVRQQALFKVIQGLNRPLFHVDLTSALQSAVTNVRFRGELQDMNRKKSIDTGVLP